MRKLVYPLLGLAALALFNPAPDAFDDYVEARAEEFLSDEIGDSRLGQMLSDLGAGVTRSLVRRVTDRDNYFFFSIYTIDLDGPDADEAEWRFLGLAGRFFELRRPEQREKE